MRKLFAVALLLGLVGLTGTLRGQDTPKAKAGSLKVGDAAPALKATKWLQGEEVKEFSAGKVYVVEFWATWCGPCIVMMPHMADLQAEYKTKGVTFIGYTANGPNNSQEKVTAFVEKRGPKLGYTFAYADDRTSYDNWMRAAGRGGIPCCFVVDKGGKIAYIGHPMYLDVVLPAVAAGTWKNDEDNARVEKIEKEVGEVFQSFRGKDSAATLKALTDFETAHPQLNHIPYFIAPKLTALLKEEKFTEAKKFAEAVVARAAKQHDPLPLRTVGSILRSSLGNEKDDLVELSVKAAEAGLKIAGDKDPRALLEVAEAHLATGDKAKAKDYATRAIAAASDEPAAVKNLVETQAKKIIDDK